VAHGPSGAVGHMAAPKLPPRGGIARSHETCGNVRTHLGREARSGADGYMVALELTSTRRRDPMSRDT
jgi:hypothetical protein